MNLDARGYEEGAAQAIKTRQNLAGVANRAAKADTDLARKRQEEQDKQAKADEANARRTIEGIQRVRNELLGLFALVTAGRGVKALVGDIVSGDAATGRLAATLGMATQELAAWQGVAERNGGSAAGITTTMQSMSQALELWKTTSEGGDFIPWLDRFGVKLLDAQGKYKTFTQLAMDMADVMQRLSGPAAILEGGKLGWDPGTSMTLHNLGGAGLKRELAEQVKLGLPNDADARNAQELQNQIKGIQKAFEDVLRVMLRGVGPAIHDMLAELTAWIEANGPRLKSELLDKVQQFVAYMRQVDWPGIGTEIEHIAGSIEGVVKALGGWQAASEALLTVWSVSKISGMLAALALFKLGVPGALIGGVAVANGVVEGKAQEEFKAGGTPTPTATDDWFAQKFGTRDYKWEGQSKVTDDAMTKLPEVLERLLDFLGMGGSTTPASTGYGTATPSERVHAGMLLGSGTPGPDSATAAARAKQAYDYYTSNGLTPAQASGLVARMKLESNFNPGDVGDHGAAYGILQWHSHRREMISKYLGKSIIGSSFEDQLKGSVYEFRQGEEQAAGRALAASTTPTQAGNVVSRNLIRPGLTPAMQDWEAHRTGELAERYYKTFTAPAAPAAPTAPPAPPSAPSWPGGVPLSSLVPSPGDRYSSTSYTTDNSSTSETHMNGDIHLHTKATDAEGIAADIKRELARNDSRNAVNTMQSNRGVA